MVIFADVTNNYKEVESNSVGYKEDYEMHSMTSRSSYGLSLFYWAQWQVLHIPLLSGIPA